MTASMSCEQLARRVGEALAGKGYAFGFESPYSETVVVEEQWAHDPRSADLYVRSRLRYALRNLNDPIRGADPEGDASIAMAGYQRLVELQGGVA